MTSLISFCLFLFWAWMFYSCFLHERGQVRLFWALTIIFLHVFGATFYLIIRWLPQTLSITQASVKRKRLKHDLQQAMANVRNIGKAYQYVQLGYVYEALQQTDHALAAYQQALAKEPDNIDALWGSAVIELEYKNSEQAITILQQLMEIRPDFKFGDASLAYGKALFEYGDFNLAQQHLENHLKQWSHPEAALLMAKIQTHQQNTPRACKVLETMITNVQGAPDFHYRKHRQYVVQGQRLLKNLNCRLN